MNIEMKKVILLNLAFGSTNWRDSVIINAIRSVSESWNISFFAELSTCRQWTAEVEKLRSRPITLFLEDRISLRLAYSHFHIINGRLA
jgi:hypothetical protein